MTQINRITTWPTIDSLQAAALNNEFNNIINAWNNTDAGIMSWTNLSISGLTTFTGAVTFSSTILVSGASTFSTAITITPTSNQIILGTTRTVTITAPTPAASSRTWTIPDITGAGTFAALEGTQTFTGIKTFSAAPIISALTASTVPYLDASKVLTSSAVTPTELGYVSGVNSAIQTQMNLKAPLASPTFTGTITTPLTASRVVTSNGSSQLAVSTATTTEIDYVHGVTSAIQTQMDLKSPLASPTFTGVVTTAAGSAGTPALQVSTTGGGLYKDSGGSDLGISAAGVSHFVMNGQIYCKQVLNTLEVDPTTDNSVTIGHSGLRYSAVWAANGTIQTSMESTKTNIVEMQPDECKIPKAIYFTRPGEKIENSQLGFEADILPEEAHPVINNDTGERSTDDIYTSSVIAMLCQAARNDYDRLAALESRIAVLEPKSGT